MPERGTLFGNRGGRIHDPATRGLTRRRYTSRRWICCELQFKGRRRNVFGSRRGQRARARMYPDAGWTLEVARIFDVAAGHALKEMK